jgi:hypothetical protein
LIVKCRVMRIVVKVRAPIHSIISLGRCQLAGKE